FAGLVFHAAGRATLAEQQIAAFLPPQRPFETRTESGGENLGSFSGDDGIEPRIEPLDARIGAGKLRSGGLLRLNDSPARLRKSFTRKSSECQSRCCLQDSPTRNQIA